MRLLEAATPPQREHVRVIFRRLGSVTIPAILQTLLLHESRTVRKDCCTILESFGKTTLTPILTALEDEESPWYFVRNLCALLGKHSDPLAADMLVKVAQHDHPKVRREALLALGSVEGSTAEPALLAGLKDAEPSVQRAALGPLNSRDCTHPELVAFLERVLRLQSDPETEAPPGVQIAALRCAERLALRSEALRATLLPVLAEVVRPPQKAGLLSRLKGAQPHKDETVRLAACPVLATVGSETAIDALTEALGDRSKALQKQAAQSLAQVEERTQSECAD